MKNQKGFAHILITLVLITGLAVGVYLVGRQTNIFPKAQESSPQTEGWIDGISAAGGDCDIGNNFQCDLNNALIKDGKYTGLALPSSGSKACKINNSYVTSCVTVDLGSTYEISQVKVDYQMIDNICGDSCSGTACGTNPGGLVFSSLDQQNWTNIGSLGYSVTPTTQTFNTSDKTKYIKVCRGGGGGGRSNLAVDSVSVLEEDGIIPTPIPTPISTPGDDSIALEGKHLAYVNTYRTISQAGKVREIMQLGYYDFLADSQAKISYYWYDPGINPQPLLSTKRHNPMKEQLASCQGKQGFIAMPKPAGFNTFNGTWSKDGDLIKIKIGTVMHEWRLSNKDNSSGFYEQVKPYYDAATGINKIGGVTYSDATGYAYLADEIVSQQKLTPEMIKDKYQGKSIYKNSYGNAASVWRTGTITLQEITTHTDNPDVLSCFNPVCSINNPQDKTDVPCGCSLLVNSDPGNSLLMYVHRGHDYSNDNCYSFEGDKGHYQQMLGIKENGNISKIVYIEQDYEPDSYPIVAIGRIWY